MKALFYIFLGGGLGSVLRFLISNYAQKLWNFGLFPFGTFVVNIVGCFLIGLFSGYFLKFDNPIKYLIIAGFCGGFTTFSAFSVEGLSLWQNGNYAMLVFYISGSIILGIFAVAIGMKILH